MVKRVFVLPKKNLSNIVTITSIFLLIVSMISMFVFRSPDTNFTTMVMLVGVVIHELAHFVFIRLYKVKWKPFLKIWAIGYDPVGGIISTRQWLMISSAGFLSTIPLFFVDPFAFFILSIASGGDLAVSLKFLKYHPSQIAFTPKNILLIR